MCDPVVHGTLPTLLSTIPGMRAPPPPASPGSGNIVQPLTLALVQCFSIVAIGYACRRARVFSKTDIEGISGFVARIALPALILLHTATLDLSALSDTARLISAILVAKIVLFVIVVADFHAIGNHAH